MKAIILLSPGIDSPVAAHMMKKKGLELIGLNFFINNHNAVDKIAKKLGISNIHH
ncbi:MAG: tRNA 4-thiouridine(8) synthase ThiI, partial [Nanoarchaeota archaeon]|nr:tRNA 4-thiouridine(8) synthase ThiI [Nanoarchaeota archaeon]